MRMWVAALAMSRALPAGVTAQGSYPARPVTIVVPASPGGVTDMLGRTLAQRFTEAWGQQALVEN
jgi:tripartite-type tricarboxylate transporter receptor subunit TctC